MESEDILELMKDQNDLVSALKSSTRLLELAANEIDRLQKVNADFAAVFKNNYTDFVSVQTNLSEQKDKFQALERQKFAIEGELFSLKEHAANQKAEINRLLIENREMKSHHDCMHAASAFDKEDKKNEFDKLQLKFDDLVVDYTNLQTEYQELNANYLDLQTEMFKTKNQGNGGSRISALEAENAELKTTIEFLEHQADTFVRVNGELIEEKRVLALKTDKLGSTLRDIQHRNVEYSDELINLRSENARLKLWLSKE
jgi:predicted  nucleic acid-binding Zn-ribbon protein